MASASHDHRPATARRKVGVTRYYSVECSECGIIDSRRHREQAERAAREHRRGHLEQPDLRQGGEPFLFRRR
jgi:hypothetical protein